jgi:type I restriction enzyme S subunit
LKPGYDHEFIYYWLSANVEELERHASGSTFRELSGGSLKKMRVRLPRDLAEQRAIAQILGSLDDKIELNRRMSETLEGIARTIFTSWFVDFDPVRAKAEGRDPGLPQPLADLFPDRLVDSELGEIPEGWDVGPLSQFFDIGLGGAWGEDEQSVRAAVAVRCLRGIDCHDLAEGHIPDVPVRWVSPKQAADRELPEGAILIEGSGSFCGRSMIWRRAYGELLGGPVGYSNFCKRLDPRCSAAQAAIVWMQMRQAYRDGLLQSFRTGTAFPNFDVHGALSNLIVVVPPVPLAQAFGEMFALSQRLDLMAQSRTLAALRDALLPKLISGELRVADAERFMERVGS